MIIRPVDEYKDNRAKLPDHEKVQVDALIYDMLNVSTKLKQLSIDAEHHYFQITLKSGFVLQFIVDIETDSLLVLLYNGI